MNGAAPKDMATSLYSVARFKYRSVSKELQSNKWIRNIGPVDSAAKLEEYVMLYMTISTIILSDQHDKITWRWTSNGIYSATSAYSCQFKGATIPFPAKGVWKAEIEHKCRFFAWLTPHNRIQMVDNLTVKGCPNEPTCSLCFCQEESTAHLLTQCNFTEALWNMFANLYHLPNFLVMNTMEAPLGWVNTLISTGASEGKRKRLGLLLAFWWQVWKERNRRIFVDQEHSTLQVFLLLQDRLNSFRKASRFLTA
jgi:hypothetical protein